MPIEDGTDGPRHQETSEAAIDTSSWHIGDASFLKKKGPSMTPGPSIAILVAAKQLGSEIL
jgi:hypothetical protein